MLTKIRSTLNRLLPRALRPASMVEKFLSRHLRSGPVIMNGPFKGMRYISESTGSMLAPKILGAYEVELNQIVQRYLSDAPGMILDVGAAEGYYAIGLAWLCPKVRVVAYEAEPAGRDMMARLAGLNGVSSRVEINGFCGMEDFLTALKNHIPGLVVMDIEGGEGTLLAPDSIPWLKQTDLLVELHPWTVPGIGATLAERFRPTHEVHIVETRRRNAADLPFGFFWNHLMARWLVPKLDEGRPEAMRWLHLVAKKA